MVFDVDRAFSHDVDYSPRERGGASQSGLGGKTVLEVCPPSKDDAGYLEYRRLHGSLISTLKLRFLKACEVSEAKRDKVMSCMAENSWDEYRCSECGAVIKRPVGACNSRFCPVCQKFYSLRKARESFHMIRCFSGHQIRLVFTIPDRYWGEISDHDQVNRLLKAIRKTLSRFYGLMVGGLYGVHTWRTEDPWEWYPHVEVIMSAVGFSKKGFVKGLKLWLVKKKLDELRSIYKEELEKEFGWKIKGIDIFYQFIKDNARLMHVLKYALRPAIDSFKELQYVPHGKMGGIARHFVFRSGWRSYRWFGFMSHNVRMKYAEKLEVDISLPKLKWWQCPECRVGIIQLTKKVRNGEVTFHVDPPELDVRGLDRPPPIPRISNKLLAQVLEKKKKPLVEHTFEALCEANPSMPEWMIRMSLKEGKEWL